MDANGNILDINNEMRIEIDHTIEKMAKKGLRTLVLAFNDFELKGI
jgi:magnesium-transporting ATPase (P-type)